MFEECENQPYKLYIYNSGFVVGVKSYRNIGEPRGLGRRNQRVQISMVFCEGNVLFTSTWFKQRKRRL